DRLSQYQATAYLAKALSTAGLSDRSNPRGSTLKHHNIQRAADPKLSIEHQRQLSDGHPVSHRYGKHSNKLSEGGLKKCAFHLDAAYRVWTVKDNEALARFSCGFHSQRHRVNERVHPRADVRNIENEYVHVAEHFRAGSSRLAVQRIHRQGCPRVLE